MKYLIINPFFIGDVLFSSSIARKLKEEGQATQIDFLIRLPQPKLLLQQNKWIDNVYVGMLPPSVSIDYNKIIQLQPISQDRPATIQFQEQAGVKTPSVGYEVNTVPKEDDDALEAILELSIKHPNKKIVAYQADWKDKAYQTTLEQYWKLPKEGGPHRDIDRIIKELEKEFCMVQVGLTSGIKQYDPRAMDEQYYSKTASFIKYCDYFIGSEGGLSNLAAGIGTKTIITTCFIGQLYGINGFMKQIQEPKMGPATYFPNLGHSHLPPFISDTEVIEWIKKLILNNETYVFDWSTLKQ